MEAEQKFNGKRGKKERDGDWKKRGHSSGECDNGQVP